MRRLKQLFWLSFCIALLTLAARGLVRGPAPAADAPMEARLPRETAWTAALSQCEQPQREAKPEEGTRRLEPVLFPADDAAAKPITADRNGRPITGRTYADTVYVSCPPEGTFG